MNIIGTKIGCNLVNKSCTAPTKRIITPRFQEKTSCGNSRIVSFFKKLFGIKTPEKVLTKDTFIKTTAATAVLGALAAETEDNNNDPLMNLCGYETTELEEESPIDESKKIVIKEKITEPILLLGEKEPVTLEFFNEHYNPNTNSFYTQECIDCLNKTPELRKLLTIKNDNNKCRFLPEDIVRIAKSYRGNIECVYHIAALKRDDCNDYVYDSDRLSRILDDVTDEEALNALLDIAKIKENGKYKYLYLLNDFTSYCKNDIGKAKEWLSLKTADGEDRFDCGYDLKQLLKLKEIAPNGLEKMLKLTDKKLKDVWTLAQYCEGNPQFNPQNLSTQRFTGRELYDNFLRFYRGEGKNFSELADLNLEGQMLSLDNLKRIFQLSDNNTDELLHLLQLKDKNGNLRFINENSLKGFHFDSLLGLAKYYKSNPDAVEQMINMKDLYSDEYEYQAANEIDDDLLSLRNYLLVIKDLDMEHILHTPYRQKDIVLKHPERYVNGNYSDKDRMINSVLRFFSKNKEQLQKFCIAYDKETLNYLLRQRFQTAKEYLNILSDFSPEEILLLKRLSNSLNQNGKAFMPAQKLQFINLLAGYKNCGLSLDIIEENLESGCVNLGGLERILLSEILAKCGIDKETQYGKIPRERILSWNLEYAHLLAKEYEDGEDPGAISEIIEASTSFDFNEYIHSSNLYYGEANKQTKSLFESLNMNYDKWEKPSDKDYVHFIVRDQNQEQLQQITSHFIEDVETLRRGPVKVFIDKQYPQCIQNGEFIIPEEYTASKGALKAFIEGFNKALEPVWARASKNIKNPEKSQTARTTLTIKNHFEQRVKDIESLNLEKEEKELDLTIKMWDRIPQKDLFQGNYSTCCIGMNEGNGWSMPVYLMHTAFNMIELVDNNTGKTIGNALCYFVTDNNNKPILVIDNIEIKNSDIPSKENQILLRNAITEYASRVAKEVCSRDDIEIIIGPNYNDVLIDDLPKVNKFVKFLGKICTDEVYTDLFEESLTNNLQENISGAKLK